MNGETKLDPYVEIRVFNATQEIPLGYEYVRTVKHRNDFDTIDSHWIDGHSHNVRTVIPKEDVLIVARRRESAVVEDLKQAIAEREQQSTKWWQDLQLANKKATDLTDSLTKMTTERDSYQHLSQSRCKDLEELRARLDPMVRDLDKLRKAVGEIRFKEILGG